MSIQREYAIGQVWSYHAREDEEDSLLHIAAIEHEPEGEIFHVCITGLRMKSRYSDSGMAPCIGHAPVTRDVLNRSVTELHSFSHTAPDIAEGYSAWRAAYESRDAGVFSISIREVVETIENAINSGSQA